MSLMILHETKLNKELINFNYTECYIFQETDVDQVFNDWNWKEYSVSDHLPTVLLPLHSTVFYTYVPMRRKRKAAERIT